jgi:hypothetical protein
LKEIWANIRGFTGYYQVSNNVTNKKIATKYNISTSLVGSIKNKKTWKHVKIGEVNENE